MKTIIITLLILLYAPMASATEGSSNLSMIFSSLSSLLSSTNPSISYAGKEPKSGDAAVPIATSNTTHINELPPLVADPEAIYVPIPKKPANVVAIDSNNETAIKLSPQTKKMLAMAPSNLNKKNYQMSGKLLINHGEFENSQIIPPAPAKIDSKTDNAANASPPPAPVKPKFEISIQNSVDAESNELLLDRALSALKIGQYESSATLYKTILKRDPKNRDALFGLATAYHKNGQHPQAKEAYAKLMSKYPDFKDGLNNVLVFASEEAPDDALVELDKLSKRNPQFAPLYAQKATIYYKKGDNQAAAANLVKALKIEPSNVAYKFNLATCYDRLGQNLDAIRLYNELVELSYKGQKLPAPREALVERVAYLGGQKISETAMR